jgi:DNA-binding transcriptional MocR family regulator
MTSTDEATFITLWQQALSHDAMATRLGCPVGTVESRAHRLQQQGVIQPRPRGRGLALPTAVHPSSPLPSETALRLLSLLPDLEVMVTRERDRQRLLRIPKVPWGLPA